MKNYQTNLIKSKFYVKTSLTKSLVLKLVFKYRSIHYRDIVNYLALHNVSSTKNGEFYKISCIVTCNSLERLDYLNEALQSIIEQNYKNIQVIVVDGTGEVQSKLTERGLLFDQRFIFKPFKSRRPSEARNAFLGDLDGEIVTFLDDDNLFLPGYFFSLSAWHKNNLDIDVGIFRHILFENEILIDLPIARNFSKRVIERRNISDTSALSFKKHAVSPDFWPNTNHAEDWHLLKKCLNLHLKIKTCNYFCLLYRIHGKNRSNPTVRKTLFER